MNKNPDRSRPEDCRNLEQLRGQIDLLDDELLKLLAERSGYVRRAVQLKPKERIVDKPRIEAMVTRLKADAERRNIDPKIIERLWRAWIAAFIEMERKIAKD